MNEGTRDGQAVVSASTFGRALSHDKRFSNIDLGRVTLVHDDNILKGVWIPHDVWLHIQRFVGTVIER